MAADSLSNRLKDAIAGADFEGARTLTAELSENIKADLQSLPSAHRQAAFDRGLRLLGDALTAARVIRAHIAMRLTVLRGHHAYQSRTKDHSWSVDA